MAETRPFTIESFYQFVNDEKLMAAKCRSCGTLHLPPRPLCMKCFSKSFKWVEAAKKGRLLTYTVIHVAPPQFQSMVPYVVGIVRLQDGLKLPGMIQGLEPEKLEVGIELEADFDKTVTPQWPVWPRYFFRPPQ